MRVLLQRTSGASVSVKEKELSKIEKGLVILVGFTYNDTIETIEKMVDKVIHLRIFDDGNGIMNLSLLDVEGSILSISQFTLYANTEKGRRPSYTSALKSEESIKLYDIWNEALRSRGIKVGVGKFGADMKVSLVNDGPVTIWLESGNANEKG